MPIDPMILPLMPQLAATGGEGVPAGQGARVPERRAQINRAADALFESAGQSGPEVGSITTHDVPVHDGSIVVRLYRPAVPAVRRGGDRLPAHFYVHGGSWWQGTIDARSVDATCRNRCAGATCVVAAVEYRLAPEFPFPAPLEDCYAALAWLFGNAAALGIEPGSVSVGGCSAGANLAAAVAILARDRGLPWLALQVLEVPAVDLTLAHLAHVPELGESAVAEYEEGVRFYVPGREDRRRPLASPLFTERLAGLAPAHVIAAEYDILRGDAEAYANALGAAGVPVVLRCHPGQVHMSPSLTRLVPAARAWEEDLVAALRAAHGVAADRYTTSRRGARAE